MEFSLPPPSMKFESSSTVAPLSTNFQLLQFLPYAAVPLLDPKFRSLAQNPFKESSSG